MRSFGQHAGLINAINKITRDYPETSVLGELIQNADDAGATEIHFVYDQQQYPTGRLLGASMGELQGESLLVFNNQPFSQADLINISEIAAASKASDAKKIGRFGVGFVSTYHLTDTPSFVTGNKFCMFDPLRKYVPTATAEEPGVLCDLDPEWVSDFSDQFAPFAVFGCKPGEPFNGTIFRFPLRKGPSELKSSGKVDIVKLLQGLNQSNLLLFLKNIKRITVSNYKSTAVGPQKCIDFSFIFYFNFI